MRLETGWQYYAVDIYMEAVEYLFADSKITVEQALNETLSNRNMQLSVDFF